LSIGYPTPRPPRGISFSVTPDGRDGGARVGVASLRGTWGASPSWGVQMRFLVQLLLAFLAGLALGYVLLSVWDVIAPAGLRL
jgi:hypothetical protein